MPGYPEKSLESRIWILILRNPLLDAVMIHVLRFAVLAITLEVASLAGVTGWTLGLVANLAVTGLAVILMTKRRLWRSSGMTTAWRSWAAGLAVLPLAFEAITWALPAGITAKAPGFALWALTLLLVGANEELISRGVVLGRLRLAYRPIVAVGATAALFGLQHLSALALTSRETGDVLGNVALSAISGFALAAFQMRFRWLWPLIIVHALADWVTILASAALPDLAIAGAHLGLLAFGLLLLRRLPREWPAQRAEAPTLVAQVA